MKVKVKTNLGQRVQAYSSTEEFRKQFEHDVFYMGKELAPTLDKFDFGCIYDQSVLGTILCDFLAILTVAAEKSDPHFSELVIRSYKQTLKCCREVGDLLFTKVEK